MRPLSLRERRLVAIGILIGIVGVIWLGAIAPVVDGFLGRAEERETLTAQYQRNARVLASIPLWKRQALAQKRNAAQFAYVAPTESIAGQQLQQRFARSVGEVGGLVRSATPLTGAAGAIKIRADTQLTMSQLYHLLQRLQNEQPYVVVEYLAITADRAFETGHLAPMDVRFQLTARVVRS